jgi:haloacetate dehalogenase
MAPIDRRELMKQAVSVAGAAALARPVNAAEQASAPAVASGAQFFPGFTSARVKTAGVEINLVHAGSGPPLLLLHGAPQTHVSWRLVAPELAKSYTVIAATATPANRPTPRTTPPTRSGPWRSTRWR